MEDCFAESQATLGHRYANKRAKKSNVPHSSLHYPSMKLNEKVQIIGLLTMPSIFGTSPLSLCLKIKQLFHYPHCVLRTLDTMPNCPAIFENLIIVSTLERFVAKEVDGRIINTTERLLRLQVFQTISLVPACGKYIEGNLPTN